MNSVGENIKRIRKKMGLTQEQLATKLGYQNRQSVMNIEKGYRDLSISEIDGIARSLGTTRETLMMSDDIREIGDDEKLRKLGERLSRNGYEVEIFSTAKEAVDYVARRCEGKTVGLGDSITFNEIGLIDRLRETVGDGLYASEIRKNRASGKRAMTSDVFILTVSAIAYDTGEIVNISNRGSRIAGSLYYSDEIIFVVSKNKIAPDLTGAMDRARNIYAVKMARKGNYRVPCVETGKCEYCNVPDKTCRTTCIYHNPPILVHSTVLLIDEDLGY